MNALLAGPIVRRAEPDRICIWVATADSVTVRAEVYRFDSTNELESLAAADGQAVRLGPGLVVHLVEISGDDPFPVDELLAYDVRFGGPNGDESLGDLGLTSGPGSIVYQGLPLPTFFIRADLPALNMLHGSCRLLHGLGEDALLSADEAIARRARDLSERPGVLLLTGDQIYGDEVAGPLIMHVTSLGATLAGPDDDGSVPGVPSLAALGVYGRAAVSAEKAKFTSGKADNHLMSFGEFAAMYLLAWNPEAWPEKLPEAPDVLAPDAASDHKKQFETERAGLDNIRPGVIAARRVFANVPTYMIFDDHDVTDDWNITSEWRRNVEGSPTGRRVIANALAAFWAFQGWGNEPDLFDDSFKKTVGGYLSGDPAVRADSFESTLLRFDKWSFSIPTTPRTIVLDTRTRRDFDSEVGAPRLLDDPERKRVLELAESAHHRSGELLVLVSPVPVFGLELQERRQKFLVGKLGPYEIDFEAWHSNLQGFVDFMCLLVDELALEDCILLSGDVHYGLNVRATFEAHDRTVRFAQFVSSSFKHSGALSRMGLDLLGRLVTNTHERLGWDRPPELDDNRRFRHRAVSRAANTDEWAEDAPVFLAPWMAKRMGLEGTNDYREHRNYVRPAERGSSMLIGENNVGLVSIDATSVKHELLGRFEAGTRTRTVELMLPLSRSED